MGRMAMIITDDMVDELQDILISAGIDVEKEMCSDIDSSLNLPPFFLHCKNKIGERVDLGFRRCDHPPHELVITLFTVYKSFWGSFKKTQLRPQITELLLKHGAKDVGVESKKIKPKY
jgi:hypothetical protein